MKNTNFDKTEFRLKPHPSGQNSGLGGVSASPSKYCFLKRWARSDELADHFKCNQILFDIEPGRIVFLPIMKVQDLQAELKAILEQYAQMASDAEQALLKKMLNLIEHMAAEIEELKGKVQELRDENNHLKGEQGKPDIALAIQNAGFWMIWKLSANRSVSDLESLLQRLRKKSLIAEVNILASGK